MTTRRAFLGTLAGFLAAPLDVRAQQPAKVSRIGWLLPGSLEALETRALLCAFRQGARERGYVEAKTSSSSTGRRRGSWTVSRRWRSIWSVSRSTSSLPGAPPRPAPHRRRPPPSRSSRHHG